MWIRAENAIQRDGEDDGKFPVPSFAGGRDGPIRMHTYVGILANLYVYIYCSLHCTATSCRRNRRKYYNNIWPEEEIH